ncbi:MAG: DUF2726 domain-containing protein [Chthoniobacterales bacterium]|jgi:Protein of unknown function (DUF2726)
MEAVLVVFLLGGFLLVLGTTLLASRHVPQRPAFAGLSVHGHAFPYRRRIVLFSKAERSFYKALRSLVPDHMIFVKVKLADLVTMKPRQSLWEYFSPINRQHVDFVICDPTLAPVVAIALDSANQHSSAAAADMVNSVLASASLPVLHVPQKRRYLFDELRRLLTPYLAVPRPLL